MKPVVKKSISLVIKLAVAVVGLWFVIHKTQWEDQATLKAGTELREVVFLDPVQVAVLPRQPANAAEAALDLVHIRFGSQRVRMKIPVDDNHSREVTSKVGEDEIADGLRVGIPNDIEIQRYNLVEKDGATIHPGLKALLGKARLRWELLLASLVILGIPFFVTAYRWQKLMQPQGIFLPFKKCLALCFVGQFYSTFLPGTTSGDFVKIVYTAKVTGAKTKSAVTVLLDRAIGLVALMFIGGVAAALQARNPTMLRVSILVFSGLAALAAGSVIYFSRRLRKAFGLAYILEHSKLPEFVKHADEALHAYRHHFGLIGEAFFLSLIAQAVTPISAWLAGVAIGMNAPLGSYVAYVPVAILAAALPISFMGLGVMDSILLHFFSNRGLATASEAFALAQAIRFFPVMWNMLGAYWVVHGDYSRHEAQMEDKAMEDKPQPAQDGT